MTTNKPTIPTSRRQWFITAQRDLYEGNGPNGEVCFEDCTPEEAESFAIFDDEGQPAQDPAETQWFHAHTEPTLDGALRWAFAHGYTPENYQNEAA